MNLDSAIFYSNDIQKVIPFYLDVLGFTLEYQTSNYVSFLFPNGGKLGIKNSSEPREVPGHQTVFIKVEDVQNVYEELQQKQVTIYKPLEEKSWGTEFSILDPDLNIVLYVTHPKP